MSKLPAAAKQPGLTFAKDIKPLFEASCFGCHGEEKHKGDLRVDSLEAILKGSEDGKVVDPGHSLKSSLLIAVSQIDDETAMPPKPKAGRGGPGGPGGRGGFGPGMFLAPQMISQADKDGDKKVTRAEFTALADVWYDKLDSGKAGKLNQEEFTTHLGEVMPPREGGPGGRGPGGPGGGRGPGGGGPARFIGPALFGAADADKDGSLTRGELKGAFGKWFTDSDKAKTGSLDEETLRDGLNGILPPPQFGGPGGPGGPGGGRGPGGPGGPGGGPGGPGGWKPPTPLTTEQVALVRAWIDQGAK